MVFGADKAACAGASNVKFIFNVGTAYRRIEKLARHLETNRICTAIVPMPGTNQHREWMRVLSLHPKRSYGMQVLEEWVKYFFQSGPEVRKALGRILVISTHLSAPSFKESVFPIEVN
uniref:Uncharacterized protein n=1 Tax=Mucochytrium quahogii TaxID=96639 RepID=A0A7S2R6L7_9STRA|mmetsp:Transcript_8587/g.13934  ORF Transcript_8587/g.13934 Transcript_8587/m.13934 type:complete len:118 (-) Transcript_8587:420-773(-)